MLTRPTVSPCGNLGYAGSDLNGNAIRLYSQAECTQLNGIWYTSGECVTKPAPPPAPQSGLGSYSYNCRVLNKFPSTPKKKIITPPECLVNKVALGRPSNDKLLRYYTRAECTQLNGIWSTNNKCSKKTGGSYSQICRVLN